MSLIKSLRFVMIFALIFTFNNKVEFATSSDKPKPLEEFYPESGFKTIEAASAEFEDQFKQPLKLPLRVPPISFTHYFGRFQHTSDGMNDLFEVEVKNDKVPKNHYMIVIRPIVHKINFNGRTVLGTYQLKNGKPATLYELGRMKHTNRKSSYDGFNLLVFERENWQYQLSIDRRVADIVTPEVLVEIANSIDYPAERPIE
ncbi:hypothetical protein COJ46_01490 [Bacillus sp. AFS077874]|uniref:hypothetical protein n=1 Tax=unclassified Bacillus (in: firmicutes) TaxID=185979 RepID=UPI000BECF484|nr:MULTISPECIES: hypothetical protein [unclassified Bacillus (in: firmicutes)]PEC50988.1 hypothetical protein CON00_04550 [Bacillus sp. AFS096315]PET76365.1 hypothetical protein CN514_02465 [Bacillus sp. AFS001701]PFM83220.1 hypothetical protein COJ46_01490 [Bacillus sp. AFS077874]